MSKSFSLVSGLCRYSRNSADPILTAGQPSSEGRNVYKEYILTAGQPSSEGRNVYKEYILTAGQPSSEGRNIYKEYILTAVNPALKDEMATIMFTRSTC